MVALFKFMAAKGDVCRYFWKNIWNVHTVHILTIYFGGYQVLASLKVNIEPIFSWAIPASPIHQL